MTVDYIRPAQDTFSERICCTVTREGMYVHKGCHNMTENMSHVTLFYDMSWSQLMDTARIVWQDSGVCLASNPGPLSLQPSNKEKWGCRLGMTIVAAWIIGYEYDYSCSVLA